MSEIQNLKDDITTIQQTNTVLVNEIEELRECIRDMGWALEEIGSDKLNHVKAQMLALQVILKNATLIKKIRKIIRNDENRSG